MPNPYAHSVLLGGSTMLLVLLAGTLAEAGGEPDLVIARPELNGDRLTFELKNRHPVELQSRYTAGLAVRLELRDGEHQRVRSYDWDVTSLLRALGPSGRRLIRFDSDRPEFADVKRWLGNERPPRGREVAIIADVWDTIVESPEGERNNQAVVAVPLPDFRLSGLSLTNDQPTPGERVLLTPPSPSPDTWQGRVARQRAAQAEEEWLADHGAASAFRLRFHLVSQPNAPIFGDEPLRIWFEWLTEDQQHVIERYEEDLRRIMVPYAPRRDGKVLPGRGTYLVDTADPQFRGLRRALITNISPVARILRVTLDPVLGPSQQFSFYLETNEENNVATIARPLPDLRVTDIAFEPVRTRYGQVLEHINHLHFKIRNRGNGPVISIPNIRLEVKTVWLNENNQRVGQVQRWDARPMLRNHSFRTANVFGFESDEDDRGIDHWMSYIPPDARKISVGVDTNGVVTESNEDNNHLSVDLPAPVYRPLRAQPVRGASTERPVSWLDRVGAWARALLLKTTGLSGSPMGSP